MTVSIGRYTFVSWLRRGIGNRIDQPDLLAGGTSGVAERATVQVDVALNGAAINKSFALIGPGDIIGINPLMVVRTEPANPLLFSTLEFEPNYLAFMDFYEEDFPWRYTPAKPSGEKLSPWLALLVLKTPRESDPGEFELVPRSEPLPMLRVTTSAALPPLQRNWALAHVQINEGHSSPTDFEAFLLTLRTDTPNADKIISRLFSARRLEADTAYSAFLVPAFETGRRAGLGRDTAGIDAQQPAWSGGDPVELPIYYEWSFRTGTNEDFESLVKRLEPRPVDSRVGIRDMDGATPGFGVSIGTDIGAIPPTAAPQTTIGLEGALRAPTTVSRPPAIDPAKPFFAALADVLNLADDRRQASQGTADPIVTPPIYGGHHALRQRIDMSAAGWLTELNRDPRLRVSSGFGTRVVQTNQEDYVARAWAQVKAVLAANRQFIFSRAALETLRGIQRSFVARLPAASVLAVAQSVTKKVMGSPVTIRRLIVDSRVTAAPLDAAARRLIAPRRRIGRRLSAADPEFAHHRLIEDINSGRVTAAPPKKIADDLVDDVDVADAMAQSIPAWLRILGRYVWLIVLVLLALALVAFVAGLWPVALGLGVGAAAAVAAARRANRRARAAAALADPATLPDTLRSIGPQPGFTFLVTDPPAGAAGATSSVGPVPGRPAGFSGVTATYSTAAGAGRDTVEAANFRSAAIALSERLAIRPAEPVRPALDLANAAGKVVAAMAPEISVLKLLAGQVVFPACPEWLREPEHLVPAIAYPRFDDAMYAKLRDISPELFLPNIGLIAPETITLLKTNPAFIESYMVGLNHEFGRELLWREYITDERGSYFQQFWSVDGIVPPAPAPGATGPSPGQLKAMYRDIVPIDTWPSASALGQHRPPQRPKPGDLVLTVRGEIVKRHKMLIYAQKAHMARNKQGQLDPHLKPVIKTIATQAEMDAEIKFPIFKAEVEPDIRFFGFDLLVAEVKGDENPQVESDDWGWYFILQELPGEARFGMDTAYDPDDDPQTPITWNDLSWTNMPGGTFLDPAVPPVSTFWSKLSNDLKAQWNRHSADMASILFQRPVMVAVHAREMLENISA